MSDINLKKSFQLQNLYSNIDFLIIRLYDDKWIQIDHNSTFPDNLNLYSNKSKIIFENWKKVKNNPEKLSEISEFENKLYLKTENIRNEDEKKFIKLLTIENFMNSNIYDINKLISTNSIDLFLNYSSIFENFFNIEIKNTLNNIILSDNYLLIDKKEYNINNIDTYYFKLIRNIVNIYLIIIEKSYSFFQKYLNLLNNLPKENLDNELNNDKNIFKLYIELLFPIFCNKNEKIKNIIKYNLNKIQDFFNENTDLNDSVDTFKIDIMDIFYNFNKKLREKNINFYSNNAFSKDILEIYDQDCFKYIEDKDLEKEVVLSDLGLEEPPATAAAEEPPATEEPPAAEEIGLLSIEERENLNKLINKYTNKWNIEIFSAKDENYEDNLSVFLKIYENELENIYRDCFGGSYKDYLFKNNPDVITTIIIDQITNNIIIFGSLQTKKSIPGLFGAPDNDYYPYLANVCRNTINNDLREIFGRIAFLILSLERIKQARQFNKKKMFNFPQNEAIFRKYSRYGWRKVEPNILSTTFNTNLLEVNVNEYEKTLYGKLLEYDQDKNNIDRINNFYNDDLKKVLKISRETFEEDKLLHQKFIQDLETAIAQSLAAQNQSEQTLNQLLEQHTTILEQKNAYLNSWFFTIYHNKLNQFLGDPVNQLLTTNIYEILYCILINQPSVDNWCDNIDNIDQIRNYLNNKERDDVFLVLLIDNEDSNIIATQIKCNLGNTNDIIPNKINPGNRYFTNNYKITECTDIDVPFSEPSSGPRFDIGELRFVPNYTVQTIHKDDDGNIKYENDLRGSARFTQVELGTWNPNQHNFIAFSFPALLAGGEGHSIGIVFDTQNHIIYVLDSFNRIIIPTVRNVCNDVKVYINSRLGSNTDWEYKFRRPRFQGGDSRCTLHTINNIVELITGNILNQNVENMIDGDVNYPVPDEWANQTLTDQKQHNFLKIYSIKFAERVWDRSDLSTEPGVNKFDINLPPVNLPRGLGEIVD